MSKFATGFAIVDAINEDSLNLLNASISVSSHSPLKYEINLSGIWEFGSEEIQDLREALENRVLVGTEDGLDFVHKHLRIKSDERHLSDFVNAAIFEQSKLQKQWQAHVEEDVKKRKNLVPPKWPEWPVRIQDSSPIELLNQLGKQPYSGGTPTEMRPLIAFGRLVGLMLEGWMLLEEERLRKKIFKAESDSVRIWPPEYKPRVFA